MAAEARYPSRRRSSRQTSQSQPSATEEKSTSLTSSPRATRARSNVAQGDDTKPAIPVFEPSVATRHSSQMNVDQPLTTQSSSPTGSSSELSQNKVENLPEPVNEAIVEYVREGKKEVLWYATPPINVAPSSKPMHSTDYLYWKQQQRQKQQGS
ncbi:hypothetical protein INT43_007234 [Umbelopsis isabellina]|uniref:Uncharacterized protein n=1 Tax=Mortierella isabellina TaxID=91625 RepID=A0A8H7PXR3_MORIS|nr:hypothetical protein INT43_007234 [Umbelopsis isabellina]